VAELGGEGGEEFRVSKEREREWFVFVEVRLELTWVELMGL